MPPPASPRPAPSRAESAATRAESSSVRIRHKPPRSWTLAASAAVVIEAALLGFLALRAGVSARLALQRDDLTHTLLEADQIRGAWSDLAERGAMLKARLATAGANLKELERRLVAAGKARGLTVSIEKPQAIRHTAFGVRGARLQVTADGPETAVFGFLLDVDRVSAIMDMENLRITGTGKGTVALRLALRHFDLSAHVRRRLEGFVAKLPSVAATLAPGGTFTRSTPLFLPSVPSDEEALRGWPRILLSGFSQDLAYLGVDGGSARSYKEGDHVTPDIVYLEKYSVNQVLLRRAADGTEVLLTVGSPTYSLKPSELRGMSEFVVTLQRQGASPLLTSPSEP